ncbi:pilus assembly PilX N-terminal domain-containing protein [Gallaecimonas mangrovi]|uniref:pilus assembly PilX N-terminal domain-containing protein n=1 Tax=Gallaecimonas mangrovi TaxID=2291597 RepID=UPI000E1FE836|nr:pilus assembly PilX N-terminal domain-containing protein [Gallaecimonas mangrovi]
MMTSKAKGFVTLTVTLIIMVMAIGVAVFTARNKVNENRILLNEVRYEQAFEASESGIEYAMAQVRKNAQQGALAFTLNSSAISAAQTTFTLTSIEDAVDFTSTYGESVTYPVANLVAVGTSQDGSTTQTHRQTLVVTPVVSVGPTSPLTVGGTMTIGGSFSVAANPNGSGRGVPISVWMSDPVDLSGSVKTCGQQEWSNGDCTSATYSSKDSRGIDIVDNDANFPDDLFAYIFGISSDNWQDIKSDASYLLDDCSSLTGSESGLIVVQGECDLKVNLGTQAEPALLLVVDGDLTLNANNSFYGVIFSFHTDPAVSTTFKSNGTAEMNGALIANHDVSITSGTFGVRFDELALANVKAGSSFQRVWRLPGSWRDW